MMEWEILRNVGQHSEFCLHNGYNLLVKQRSSLPMISSTIAIFPVYDTKAACTPICMNVVGGFPNGETGECTLMTLMRHYDFGSTLTIEWSITFSQVTSV